MSAKLRAKATPWDEQVRDWKRRHSDRAYSVEELVTEQCANRQQRLNDTYGETYEAWKKSGGHRRTFCAVYKELMKSLETMKHITDENIRSGFDIIYQQNLEVLDSHIEMESGHDEDTEAGTDPIYEAYRILVNLRDGDENASLDDAIGLLGEALDD
jgi:hypothetical protein